MTLYHIQDLMPFNAEWDLQKALASVFPVEKPHLGMAVGVLYPLNGGRYWVGFLEAETPEQALMLAYKAKTVWEAKEESLKAIYDDALYVFESFEDLKDFMYVLKDNCGRDYSDLAYGFGLGGLKDILELMYDPDYSYDETDTTPDNFLEALTPKDFGRKLTFPLAVHLCLGPKGLEARYGSKFNKEVLPHA